MAIAHFPLLIWCLATMASSEVLNLLQRGQVERMVRQVMSCGQIPGLSLAVVRGSDMWTMPQGLTNVTSREPVSGNTKFALGSLTKAFTSTLLLMLLQESGYSIDTTLKNITGNAHLFSDPLRSDCATVKDVLSHRMGLVRADLAIFGGYSEQVTVADIVSSLSCLPAQKPFRDGYTYSNFMYSLAGHLIELLSNQSYAEALKSRLLDPLDMTSTLTNFNVSEPHQGMAQPYLAVNGDLKPAHPTMFSQRPFMPAFGLASTASDMVKWLQLQLGRGVTASGLRVVAPGLVDLTHKPITPHIVNQLRPRFPQPDLTFAYGLGWHQAVYKGFRRVWHAGTLFGFTSLIWMFPDVDIAMFVAINGPAKVPDTKDRISALFYYIADMLLGDQPWLDQSTVCTYPFPTLRQKESSLRQLRLKTRSARESGGQNTSFSCDALRYPLSKYAGVYGNRLFGNVTVGLKRFSDNSSSQAVRSCGHSTPNRLTVVFGQRFSGLLIPSTNSPHSFEMRPIGIFEFSAHPTDHGMSTMPVDFFNFDRNGVPYSLRAAWRPDEVIIFGRGLSHSCVPNSLMNGASLHISTSRLCALTIPAALIAIVSSKGGFG